MTDTPFRVYYADGSTFDGQPERAPGRGVVVIAQADDRIGRMLLCRWDYYCWHPDSGQWWGHDIFGLFDCLLEPGWHKVVFGRTVSSEWFDELIRRADADPAFTPRSGPHLLDRVAAP